MSAPRRPSWFARWGWIFPAIALAGGVPNLIGYGDHAAWVRVLVGLLSLASIAYTLWLWRDGVRSDREHRELMARFDARIAEFRQRYSGGAS